MQALAVVGYVVITVGIALFALTVVNNLVRDESSKIKMPGGLEISSSKTLLLVVLGVAMAVVGTLGPTWIDQNDMRSPDVSTTPSTTSSSPSHSLPSTSTPTAPRSLPFSADGRFRADTVPESGVHYRVVEVATGRTVLTTHAEFDEGNAIKAGLYCEDGRFLAAYHYGHEGNYTWIGAWSLENGQFLGGTKIQSHTRDLADAC